MTPGRPALEGACEGQRRTSTWNHFARCYKIYDLAAKK